MPMQDGTGPFGTGPIGWGQGPCGYQDRKNYPPMMGRRRCRRGGGRGGPNGMGRNFYGRFSEQNVAATTKEEMSALENRIGTVESQLDAMLKRLKELKEKAGET